MVNGSAVTGYFTFAGTSWGRIRKAFPPVSTSHRLSSGKRLATTPRHRVYNLFCLLI
ncbi:hypothetical protein CHY_2701 [Carboxydothermus hydrogenoformans Z-2901]|uniref:Uncharacterized protein n=1 Tax=Carboxydothermus hydrogenoformans (strain ATCC BAA-161 / DSM 6008 / Z-2901) TaxID=246194 RepID=Q3A8Q1_CARHZ|nr:hypothetical protein CHY_2701 [Carboxydothermus hydrogenoformans Z-2901]